MSLHTPIIPLAAKSIQKGTPLKYLLNQNTIECLAENIHYVFDEFQVDKFCQSALIDLDTFELMQRANHISKTLKQYLPNEYSVALKILLSSMTAVHSDTTGDGIAEFFYLPHSFFIAEYGEDKKYNNGNDPFEISMNAMQELTTRFTAEFAIRPFLINQQQRTLKKVTEWLNNPNARIRRLCSEGTRPRLPWGKRIPALIADPKPTLVILESLKNDSSLFVRRSVANHLADIAKDHLELAFSICEEWLKSDSCKETKWIIRHALRYPAKKENIRAINIRALAKDKK